VWPRGPTRDVRAGFGQLGLRPAAGEAAGGQAFDEELDSASSAARQLGSEGETRVRVVSTDIDPLAPYVFLAALLPLGFLLYGRNLA
jgi:hypothetical protein